VVERIHGKNEAGSSILPSGSLYRKINQNKKEIWQPRKNHLQNLDVQNVNHIIILPIKLRVEIMKLKLS
jgi:hypothetical protein